MSSLSSTDSKARHMLVSPLVGLILVTAMIFSSCGTDVVLTQAGQGDTGDPATDVALSTELTPGPNDIVDGPIDDVEVDGPVDDVEVVVDTSPDDLDSAPTATDGEVARTIDPLAPERLSLRATGAASGPTIIPIQRPAVGETWTGSFLMSIQIELDLPGEPAASPTLPVTEMGMEIEVIDVDADGTWTAISAITSIVTVDPGDFTPAQMREYEASISGLAGISYTTEINEYGVVTNVEVDGAEDLPEELLAGVDFARQAESMTITVPAQEVGVGATWTDTITVEFNGLATEQAITYEVTDIEGTSFTVAITYEQIFDSEIVQDGTTVVFDGSVSGQGTTTIDTTKAGPTQSNMNAAGTIEIRADGETGTMGMDMRIEMSGS